MSKVRRKKLMQMKKENEMKRINEKERQINIIKKVCFQFDLFPVSSQDVFESIDNFLLNIFYKMYFPLPRSVKI